MARIPLGGLTTLNLSTDLDPMFVELYDADANIAHLVTFTPSGGGDDVVALQAAIDAAAGGRLILRSGATYPVSAELTIDDDISIETDGPEPAYIVTATNSGIALNIGGSISAAATTTLAANVAVNQKEIVLTSGTGVAAGQILLMRSTKAWYHDPREEGSISPDTDATGTAQAGGASTITLKASTTETGFAGLALTIQSGTGAGQARVVSSYVDGTKVATMTAAWKTVPDNTSVYRFAQLFKGETHLVRSVSGTTVELDLQTMDGYDVVDDAFGDGLEAVTVTVFNPLRVKLKNLHIIRPATLNANSFGIQANYCVDLRIEDVGVDYGQVAGISLSTCYRPSILRPNIKGSNDTTTGYGVQFAASTLGDVRYGTFFGNRRGVDSSGTTPARLGFIAYNTVAGGGDQEDGSAYTPQGAVENYGFGSHGTGVGTTYFKNRIMNVSRGINIRGRDEKIIENEFIGDFSTTCIDLSLGANVEISRNKYHNQFIEGSLAAASGQAEGSSFAADNINNYIAPYFVRVQSNWERGATDIRDNLARGLGRYFLHFTMAGGTFYDFDLRNNSALITPASVASECGLIGVTSGTLSLLNFGDFNNDFAGSASITSLVKYGAGVTTNGTAGVVSQTGSPYGRTVNIADDTVAKIRVSQRGNRIWFGFALPSSASWRFWGLVLINSTTLTSFGAATGVAALASEPTGTSGSDGNVSFHYDGEFLNIENRAGAAIDAFVTIMPME